MNKFSKKIGFTLIELLVVIVIIGILSGIGISQFKGQIEKAKFIKGVHFESLLRRKMLTSLDSYVAFWTFNEEASSTVLLDGSGQNNDLPIPNGVARSVTDRKYSGDTHAIAIDGSGKGIKIPGGTLLPKNKITISLWFKLNRLKNMNQLFRYVDSHALVRVDRHGNLCFRIKGTKNGSPTDACYDEKIEIDTWYHAGAVYDQNDMILYVNGIEEKRVSNIGEDLNPDNDTRMWVGSGQNTPSSVLDGEIDNVYVWGDAFDWD